MMFYIVWISSHLDYCEFEHYPFNPEFIHSILSGKIGANTRLISILGSVTVVLSLAVDAVAFQLFNSTLSGISLTYGDALVRNITCDKLFSVSAIASQQYIGNKTLEAICVLDCKDSFYEYRLTVENACGTIVYDFSDVNQTV